MSTLPHTLGALARAVGALLWLPTAIIVGWAGLVVAILGLQVWGLLAGPEPPGPLGTTLLVALVVLAALPVVVLAIRRRRWLRRSAEAVTEHSVVAGGTEVITMDGLGDRIEDQMAGLEGEQDVRAVRDAFTEARLPPTRDRGVGGRLTRVLGAGRLAGIGRALGRLERAQRALLTAAGGPTKAPYLVDDLRVTVAALAGSVATIVLGGLAILVLAAALLSR